MELYVDLFLLENFILNYIVLCVTEIIIHKHKRRIGGVFGAFFGAVYAFVAFYFGISDSGVGLISKIVAALCIVVISFDLGKSGERAKNLLKVFAAFYASSFIIAGAAFAILYSLGTEAEVVNGVIYWRGADNWLYILCCSFVVVIFIKILLHRWKEKAIRLGSIYDMTIKLQDSEVKCKALLDTGNDLHETVSGLPVIVINKSIAIALLGREYEKLMGLEPTQIIASGKLKEKRLVMIMFNSVGEECGAMVGFKPSNVTIENKKAKQCYVAVSPNEIGKNNEYSALISAEIIT